MNAQEAELDAARVIDEVRSISGPELVASRCAAEEQARQLLDDAAGRMNEAQAKELLQCFNTGSWSGQIRYNRFSPAFVGHTRNLLLENLERFNDWTQRLWDADEQRALGAADEVIRERAALPGAGRGYPTMLLYLRDPDRFAVWMNATDQGLSRLTGHPTAPRSEGIEGYLRFCEAARQFRDDHGLAPQELDAVLAHVPGPELEQGVAAAPATLDRSAFEFVAELVANNHKVWMDANKQRYKRDLRRPFRLVLEHVGQEYLADLDPELETETKFGKVLAGIRRRWPDEKGEYNPYYWGAFARVKKQEDVQLFTIIHPDELAYGLSFLSAQTDQLDRFRAFVADQPEAVWSVVEPLLARLTFAGNAEDRGDRLPPVPVDEVGDLRRWIDEIPRPSVEVRLDKEDPLVGSPRLADDIGEVLGALHPLARIAWGDTLLPGAEEESETEDEDLAEPYALEDVATETFLAIDQLEEWVELLRTPQRRQALLYGPPGTGKTFVAERLARHLAGERGRVEVVQFHPAFSYEDLIEGLRPVTIDGQIRYEVRPGIFARFCDDARTHTADHVFVIDEINRADLSSVLGELMLLLEYRGKSIRLPYSQRQFSVPRNVVVLATMNTADRSLALVDFALRRRFHAIAMRPDEDVLTAYLAGRGQPMDLVLDFFRAVRDAVSDDELAPGHSYWMTGDLSPGGLERVWRYELQPYLAEHWHEQRSLIENLDKQIGALLSEGT